MRILHVSTNYKPVGDLIGHGGVERIVTWLAREQIRQGHSAQIASLRGSMEPCAIGIFEPGVADLREENPREFQLSMRRSFDQLMERIKQMEAESRPVDIVHDHMGMFVQYLMERKEHPGFPIVLSTYAQLGHFAYKELFRQLGGAKSRIPWLLTSAASLAHQAELASTMAPDIVIEAGVPHAPLYEPVAPFFHLCMAVIQPAKRQVELAEIANNLHFPMVFAGPLVRVDEPSTRYASRFLDAVRGRIDLEGMTPAQAEFSLRRHIEAYGTVYVGEISTPALREVLFAAAAKLVLLNSTNEVFSLVVQEALARGVPVVTGPFMSARESLRGFGSIVTDLSQQAIALALGAEPFSRPAIQAYCRARFGVDVWSRLWDAAYIEARDRFHRHG